MQQTRFTFTVDRLIKQAGNIVCKAVLLESYTPSKQPLEKSEKKNLPAADSVTLIKRGNVDILKAKAAG